MNLLTIILIALAGIILGYYFAKRISTESIGSIRRSNAEKTNTQLREKKEKSKKKILELLKTKESIKNDDVEKLLGVSDSTATRYLDELEVENKIKAQDKGKWTYYILT